MKASRRLDPGVPLGIGGPGLSFIAFLDSSFLSLPEINDILIVTMVMQHPQRLVFYAAMATLGSVAGCLRSTDRPQGGEALLAGGSTRRGRARARVFRSYGVVAIFVPAILPPPAPFKIFVLLAGVSRVNPWIFAVPSRPGRGVRYGEGLLAIWWRADDRLSRAQTAPDDRVVLGAACAGVRVWLVTRRARARARPPEYPISA